LTCFPFLEQQKNKQLHLGFIIYNIGFLFIILLANPTAHEKLCPSHSNTTGLHFFTEPCISAVLPALILM